MHFFSTYSLSLKLFCEIIPHIYYSTKKATTIYLTFQNRILQTLGPDDVFSRGSHVKYVLVSVFPDAKTTDAGWHVKLCTSFQSELNK